MVTPIQQIRELRALHDEGLLSPDEFALRKNTILDTLFSISKAKVEGEIQTQQSPVAKAWSGDTDLGYLTGQELAASGKHYKLIKRIGQGGMGQVWQVNDVSTELELGQAETLALKILSPEYSDSAIHRRLLIEEATLVRKLAHENIVRVYDWGRDPATGNYFIVMEYLHGQDVDHYLSKHLYQSKSDAPGIGLQQALKILRPVAQALAYAWDKYQLVHRDLKPGNLFLCKNGSVKLLDFGISARLRSHSQIPQPPKQLPMKATPDAGTVGYRAPETGAHQQQYQPALDVYAVAIMLYQMLTGAMPFPEQRQNHHTPAKPGDLNALQWQALQKGFAWDPARRQVNVMSLLDDISKHAESATHAQQIAPAFQDSELRAEQRRQRKELELQRRQQASQALLHLQAMVSKQYPANLHTSAAMQRSEWSTSKDYLARMSNGAGKPS